MNEPFLWLIAAYAFMSVTEWTLHRYAMHSKTFVKRFPILWSQFEKHAVLHHGTYYNHSFTNATDPAAKYLGVDIQPYYSLFGLSPVWVPIMFLSPLGGCIFAAIIAAHGLIWTAIHREMHEPKKTWFSELSLYKFLRSYHIVHHEHPNRNFNVVCPGMDWIMGTYRAV